MTLVNLFRPRYRHVISLGYFCSTALELERFGFRDGSYPFDWVICNCFESALELLESGFDGVLDAQNLQRDRTHAYIVHSVRPSVDLYHDFDPRLPIEDQLDLVRAKYRRRVRRLEQAMARGALFVRYVAASDEFDYLRENMPSVLSRLRRFHPANDLLFIGDVSLPPECAGIPIYRVKADEGDVVARRFADKSRPSRRKLLTLDYPLIQRVRNYWRYRRHSPRRQPSRPPVRSAVRRILAQVLGERRLVRLAARMKRLRSNLLASHTRYNRAESSDSAERQES